ncbi:MAG: hypothetical protein A2X94_12575 [Bdellovibrionales bacterium GWB1_55_8]|nr:MAG: hypothetical protein A2X94_12575 [Bdellovibrionales bacterium GWB1_55_8]
MAHESERSESEWSLPPYRLSTEEVIAKLGAIQQGLSDEEVDKRQAIHGRNDLPKKEPPGVISVFLHQFRSPLIYVLLIAGVIAIGMKDTGDAAFIFGVVLLNAMIGSFQEWKSEKSASELQNLMKTRARVRRSGRDAEVDAEELVPGDIVLLESGAKIPADLRLISVHALSIDESLLTGESTAVEKGVDPLAQTEGSVSDQKNMAFAGSAVLGGRAEGIVVATGKGTELGAIAGAVSGTEGAKPPLLIRMEQFVRQISVLTLAAVIVLGGISLSRGMSFTDVLMMAVALAVAAIPEGLPVAMTIALSLGVSRMAKRNVIVRRLPAVEGLGSCTYIASDKTGTLTLNRQTVRVVALPDEKGGFSRMDVPAFDHAAGSNGEVTLSHLQESDQVQHLARSAALSSEGRLIRHGNGWKSHGDAIDVGFLALAHQAGLDPEELSDRHPGVARIPFESERKYAAHLFRSADGTKVSVAIKGAPEAVLPRCHTVRTGTHDSPADPEELLEEAERLAADGFRVLALATSENVDGTHISGNEFPADKLPLMEFLGFVGFIDPLRPEAKAAVAKCLKAGVQVGMVTGDHPATALAIARNLGIAENHDQLLTGKQLEELRKSDIKLSEKKVAAARVFARVNPLQKLEIVEALMNGGHFVAVTGDGVNDAPALRKANIGVAMGSGTDVAKETASIIIADDNFASIEAGIEEGRFAYANLRKVIYLLISGGAGEILLFALSLASGLPLPLLPVQLLWVNLVTNGIQDVGLAFEKGEPGVMTLPPRRTSEGIFDRVLVQETVLMGLVMGLGTFAAWAWLLAEGFAENEARNLTLLLLVLFLNFHALNCRSERTSAFRIPFRNNRILVLGICAALGIHVLSMNIPIMQRVLTLNAVPLSHFLLVLVAASLILLVSELHKLRERRKR